MEALLLAGALVFLPVGVPGLGLLRQGDPSERRAGPRGPLLSLRAFHATRHRHLSGGIVDPAAAGKQPDSDFHQPGVEFGVWLARRSMQRDLGSSTQAETERAHHYRLR